MPLSLIISICSFATKHDHVDKNEVRYINTEMELDLKYQEDLRNTKFWQDFIANNPSWFVVFNESNQLPHRAFGSPLLNSDIFSVLSDNNFIFPSDLRELTSNKNDKYINKTYVQYYKGIEVLNSKLYAKYSINNDLLAFGLDVFNDINISIIPTISEHNAIESAISGISNSITQVFVEESLKVLANPKYRMYKYHLIYEISFSSSIEEGPADYICYVDAHSGELLMRKNKVLYEAPSIGTATVSGDVYATNPYNPASSQKFKYLKAIDQSIGTDYYTDFNGEVILPANIGTQFRYKLEGLYADVQTASSTADIYQNLAASNAIIFNNSNSTIQERTAYWAVNEIHDHLKSIFPSFNSLDFPMPTNIDEAGSCNAFFDGGSINFYAEGNGCQATAKIPDVVFHEYGHAINASRYNSGSGMMNGGLNEGFADIWAFSITNSPFIGLGWDLVDPTYSIRDYQDRKVYPQDLVGEVHADGEIIAGAFWDTYLNLGSMPQMLDLFKYTYDTNVDGPDGTEGSIFTDILLEVLYADDNDANLSNGTPNDIAIVSAFALHGITLLSNAVISHNPVSVSNGNQDILIDASVGITYPWALGSANCFYKINSDSTWINLPMNGLSSFSVDIPAQLNGTVISYYISLTDNYGNESGITPVAANLTPSQNANLPYYILVGYELVEEEDFDFNVGFWQTGAIDDNATTGLWEIGVPIGSFADNGDLVQTNQQHTLGGSQCAFTGNAPSSSDGIGTNDVDGGHTTVYSPIYDLSSYNNPAFSYWRWFTNNTGANPGADWWQVLISDNGVNWIYVENNISSDNSWRKFAFRASDYVSLTSNIQLKYIASDSIRLGQNLDGGSLIEAAVDDLMLYESQANSTSINDINIIERKLIRITSILGQDIDPKQISNYSTLFYIYDDGYTEKKLVTK